MSVIREVSGKIDVKASTQTGLPLQVPRERTAQLLTSGFSFLAAVLPVGDLISQ